jgi:hypothetical protein
MHADFPAGELLQLALCDPGRDQPGDRHKTQSEGVYSFYCFGRQYLNFKVALVSSSACICAVAQLADLRLGGAKVRSSRRLTTPLGERPRVCLAHPPLPSPASASILAVGSVRAVWIRPVTAHDPERVTTVRIVRRRPGRLVLAGWWARQSAGLAPPRQTLRPGLDRPRHRPTCGARDAALKAPAPPGGAAARGRSRAHGLSPQPRLEPLHDLPAPSPHRSAVLS